MPPLGNLSAWKDSDLLLTGRFADAMNGSIPNSELLIFEDCAHAPMYEKVEEFNQKLEFLKRNAGGMAAVA